MRVRLHGNFLLVVLFFVGVVFLTGCQKRAIIHSEASLFPVGSAAQEQRVESAQQQAAVSPAESVAREGSDRLVKEQAGREEFLREQALREQTAKEQALKEQMTREQALKEHLERERAAQEQTLKIQSLKEKELREQGERERSLLDRQLKEQDLKVEVAKEQVKEQATKEQALKEQRDREKAIREEALKEQEAKITALRDQLEKERIAREREAKVAVRQEPKQVESTRKPVQEDRIAVAKGRAVREKTELANIHFDFDKHNIRPDAREILRHHLEWLLVQKNIKLVIEGHCDERGTNEYNLALGERRAQEAAKFLTLQGVDKMRIKTISYGEEMPLDPAHTEEAWSKDRRASFIIE